MSRMTRGLLINPMKLLWLPALGLAAAATWMFGTAHVLWTYRYSGTPEDKYYLSCLYVGRGVQTVRPLDGKCPLVMLLKPVDGGIHG